MTLNESILLLEKAWLDRRSEMRQSFDLAKACLENSFVSENLEAKALCNKILGYCYWRFSDFALSMEHSISALDYYRRIGDLRGEADTLNSLGAVYMFKKEHEKRLECNLKCLDLRIQLGDADDISGSMNNIGETYLEMQQYEDAIKWFHECINYPDSSADSSAWAYHNLGRVYLHSKDFNEAESYFLQSLELSASISYTVLYIETSLKLGELYLLIGENEKSCQFLSAAIELATEIGAKEEQKEAFRLLSELKEREGDSISALNYFKQFHNLFQEIHKESNIQSLKDLQFKYELENARKEAEIERLRSVELKEANNKIELQRELLEIRNREIVESIRYAQRIQRAVLKEEKHVSLHLPEHFILFKPKDIVSGDFYWAHEKDGVLYVAAADCTGHGVPGGFLTMLGIAFLNEIIARNEIQTPAQILNELQNKFVNELKLEGSVRDGMDITLMSMRYDTDSNSKELIWAGAYNPLWVIRDNKDAVQSGERYHLLEVKPDKQPIGAIEELKSFNDHKLLLNKGDLVYLFSDGYQDQFGGNTGKKLKKAGFKEVLLSLANNPMETQLKGLQEFFEDWKGDLDQVDDVCVIGMKL